MQKHIYPHIEHIYPHIEHIYPCIEHIYTYIQFRVVILSLIVILSPGRIFKFVLNETTSNFQLQIAI